MYHSYHVHNNTYNKLTLLVETDVALKLYIKGSLHTITGLSKFYELIQSHTTFTLLLYSSSE